METFGQQDLWVFRSVMVFYGILIDWCRERRPLVTAHSITLMLMTFFVLAKVLPIAGEGESDSLSGNIFNSSLFWTIIIRLLSLVFALPSIFKEYNQGGNQAQLVNNI